MKFSQALTPYAKQWEFPRLFRVFRNDGIGRIIPIPLPVINERIFSPTSYLRGVALARAWSVITLDNGHLMVPALDFEFTNFFYFSVLANEWRFWENDYLPVSVQGKVVLDAGAACGETAMFFIFHGARKVISIEPNPERFAVLERNVAAHGWPVECINDILRPEHLKMGFDFAKIDIEAGDRDLLRLDSLPPCAIETHWKEVTDAFIKKFGMKRLGSRTECVVLTNAA
jgi:hypothetical protein